MHLYHNQDFNQVHLQNQSLKREWSSWMMGEIITWRDAASFLNHVCSTVFTSSAYFTETEFCCSSDPTHRAAQGKKEINLNTQTYRELLTIFLPMCSIMCGVST